MNIKKYMYGLLNHKNILWVPIGMEEILRNNDIDYKITSEI